ncbi:hypothetical protein SARC_15709 [Sphaeroforma arctica JP610]|uniref:Conserved oligomeric Golgi complex subunit 6 n=1 Tax=Sphaeroforma arctica JP610 TaxID=667725 RepID=A0A0L0F4U5_9EUKA|nr:hypothetical protein SARC_15709 [Sphaeroforma arctica JP610]KNC71750.1 hypothetical protein SARC_15709 [Sphaeroforma arctica JP610]|eukprot:XP_014145652.1 hypothetical protein SARC_15709 [Sphaeroforma arctica JP610]
MDTESGKINGGVVDDGPINNLDGFNTTANFNTTTATTTTTKRTPTLTSTLPGTTGVVTTGANPFARKLEKILKLRLDQDKDLVESMRTLSLFYEHNTVKARRNLRSDIEKKTLEVSAECLDALSLVKDQV